MAPYGAPNFFLDEFLDPDIWYRPNMTDKMRLALVLKSRLHILAQFYRTIFGCCVIVNTWAKAGINGRVDSGIRGSRSVGAEFSMHKLMSCIDIKVRRLGRWLTGKEMYMEIMNDPEVVEMMVDMGVFEVEHWTLTLSWFHSAMLINETGKIRVIRNL